MRFEYVHNQDMAMFIIEWKDDELMLSYSDERFNQFLNIPYSIVPPIPLNDFIEEQDYQMFKGAMQKIDLDYNTFRCYMKVKIKDKFLPYVISVVSVPHLGEIRYFCFATLIHIPMTLKNLDPALNLNYALYNSTNDLLFTVQLLDPNELQITTYNAPFLDYLKLSKIQEEKKKLNKIVPPYVFHFFMNNVTHALRFGKTYQVGS